MHIGQLIKSRPVSIETLLLHEQFLQAAKDSNPMLLQYLVSDRKYLLQLLDLLTIQPPPNGLPPPEKAFFLPFLVSEFFELALPEINNALLDDPSLLTHLFQFLAPRTALHGTNAAYFAKLVSALIHHSTQKALHYLYSNKQILMDLQYHSSNQSLSDVLISILLISSGMKSLASPSFQAVKLELVAQVVYACSQGSDPSKQANSITILTEITNNFAQILDGEQMLESVVQGIDGYFKQFMLNNNPRRNLELIKICTVFYSIIKFEKNPKVEHLLQSPIYMNFCSSMARNLKNTQIQVNQQQQYRDWQHQQRQPVCGILRQVFVDIVNELLIINEESIIKAMIQTNTLQVIVDFLIKFPWNNLLHVGIEICFINLLNNKNRNLIDYLFKSQKIYQIFIDQLQDMIVPSTNKNGFSYTKGNVAYFINISNSFNEDPYVQTIVQKSQRWKEFTQKQLDLLNQKMNIAILDVNLHRKPNAALGQLISKNSICLDSINNGTSLFSSPDASTQFQEIQQQIDKKLFVDEDDSQSSHSADSEENTAPGVTSTTEEQYSVERVEGVNEPTFRLINGDDKVFLGMLDSVQVSDDALLALMGH